MTTKEKVLQKLQENKNEAVSGQQIAELCGVSRAAIWKSINSLRSEGWQISGTTNGGYVLCGEADIFSQENFEKYFGEAFPELRGGDENLYIECFKEIDSTNTYAKRLLTEKNTIKNGVIVSESQTAGRGRLGRTFYSPSNSGIYLSVIYSPKEVITQPATITAFSAVAVCRAIRKLYGIEPSIKWINDIFINGKKISGILTEGFTNFESGQIETAIIGIGINIRDNEEFFPDDVKKIAGSIEGSGSEKNVGRCQLAAEVAGQVLKILKEDPEKIIVEYKESSFLIGTEITVYPVAGTETNSYKARAVDIDSSAGLVVELEDGSRRTLTSGEVTLKSVNF